ncbi:MAG: alpha/beta fold hydrolase [Myxococcales bacterium]|nr:alpha/beta fold hydrolase [Myxococcales bacterium]
MAEVHAGGVRFHVQRLGARTEGPIVVFLHGLVMDNLSSWYFTVAGATADVAEVLLYDLRGHGNSERPRSGYDVGTMANDLGAILDEVAPGRRAVLVGNSFGGAVALAFAAIHPARVAGLCLVDAHISDSSFGAQMGRTLRLEGAERDAKIADSFKDWVGRSSDKRRNRLAEKARALVEETTLVADLDAAPAIDLAGLEALGARGVPVRLLYGGASDVLEKGRALAAALGGGAELEVLDGATHAILWEATDRVREAVLDVVRRAVAS